MIALPIIFLISLFILIYLQGDSDSFKEALLTFGRFILTFACLTSAVGTTLWAFDCLHIRVG